MAGALLPNLRLSVVVGRGLGAAALGEFALAVAVAVARVCYAASDFGIGTHLTRLVARDRARAGAEVSRFLTVRVAVVPLAMLVGMAVAHGDGASAAIVFALVALALGLVTIQGICEDAERTNLKIMLVWFAALAGAQLLLVPAYGIVGAAWAC
jgi:O-antigen/teichoic acid export membrane protein